VKASRRTKKRRAQGADQPEPSPNAIPISGDMAEALRHKPDREQVLHYLHVLITAFEEVEGFNPARHHNRTRPALWIDDANYVADVRSLLTELRKLNDLLNILIAKPALKSESEAQKAVGVVATGTKKFVESYADALGKGAAALTIGAAGALLYHFGVSKAVLDPIWTQLKVSK